MASEQEGLVGYWPLKGDCQDHSGFGNHGRSHNVNLAQGIFNGRDSYVSVEHSDTLDFGHGSFSLAAWLHTDKQVEGVLGDIISKFDPTRRKGFSLSLKSTAGGYNSQGDDRHLYFSIDDGKVTEWESAGRPNPNSNYVSNSLTVFNGDLYAGTLDAEREEDWCHVYRYRGGQEWIDCGRVGNLRTKGVGPMVVHDRKLYVSTWNYDWTRVYEEKLDYCHVYQYAGDQQWIDRGQPGMNLRLTCMASYKGKLYVAGDDRTGGSFKVFVYDGNMDWRACATLPGDFFAHAMGVYHGKLYIGTGSIHSFDGEQCPYVGTPLNCTQVHSLEVYKGELFAGAWPEGKTFQYLGGEAWEDCGRLGDSTELNALVVYNGKLYAGTIPRAEVYRYEGGKEWTRMARFFAPEGWEPTLVEDHSPEGLKEWVRVTSLTVFRGRLFASVGSCTGSILDAPCNVRGQVFSMEAGKCVSYDRDLGAGKRHVVAVKDEDKLSLYIDGELAAAIPFTGQDEYDISNTESLNIGLGAVDYFSGKIREVRAYNQALNTERVHRLYRESSTEIEL